MRWSGCGFEIYAVKDIIQRISEDFFDTDNPKCYIDVEKQEKSERKREFAK